MQDFVSVELKDYVVQAQSIPRRVERAGFRLICTSAILADHNCAGRKQMPWPTGKRPQDAADKYLDELIWMARTCGAVWCAQSRTIDNWE